MTRKPGGTFIFANVDDDDSADRINTIENIFRVLAVTVCLALGKSPGIDNKVTIIDYISGSLSGVHEKKIGLF